MTKRNRQVTKAEPRKKEAMSEIGASGLQRAGGVIDEEFLRQLKGQLFVRTMTEMSENDPIVGAMLYAIEMMARGVSWSVEAGGESAEDKRATEYMETIPNDMSHSWSDFISEWAGSAPTFGWSAFEVVYKLRDGQQNDASHRSRFNDGLYGVRKLAIRHPSTLLRWEFDDGGGVEAMVQSAAPDFKLRTIPIEKLLLFRIRSRKGSPEGRSLLRNAYVPWFRKKRIENIEAVGIERDLAGLPIAWVPPNLLAANPSASDLASLEYFKKLVKNIRRDEQEGVLMPLSYINGTSNKQFDLTLLTSGGRRQFDTSAIIERYDKRIAMTILADVILMGQDKVGSYALSISKSDLMAAGIDAMLDDIEDTLNRHLVPKLLMLNGFNVANPPQFRHGPIESVDLERLGKYVQSISAAGAQIFPSTDGELERSLLDAANLPSGGLPDPEDLPLATEAVEEKDDAEGDDEEAE